MNCTNITTDLNCCLKNNLDMMIPILVIGSLSFLFNIVLFSFWLKQYQEKQRRKKRIIEGRKARQKSRKKFSGKNRKHEIYVQRTGSTIKSYTYDEYMEDSSAYGDI